MDGDIAPTLAIKYRPRERSTKETEHGHWARSLGKK